MLLLVILFDGNEEKIKIKQIALTLYKSPAYIFSTFNFSIIEYLSNEQKINKQKNNVYNLV